MSENYNKYRAEIADRLAKAQQELNQLNVSVFNKHLEIGQYTKILNDIDSLAKMDRDNIDTSVMVSAMMAAFKKGAREAKRKGYSFIPPEGNAEEITYKKIIDAAQQIAATSKGKFTRKELLEYLTVRFKYLEKKKLQQVITSALATELHKKKGARIKPTKERGVYEYSENNILSQYI